MAVSGVLHMRVLAIKSLNIYTWQITNTCHIFSMESADILQDFANAEIKNSTREGQILAEIY
jgi:hypothetical protein